MYPSKECQQEHGAGRVYPLIPRQRSAYAQTLSMTES